MVTSLRLSESEDYMKFTSEDLLKAMGLKVGDRIKFGAFEYKVELYSYADDESRAGIFRHMDNSDYSLDVLVDEEFTLLPPKPTLTEDEKVILRNLNKRYKYINREEYGGLRVSETKPIYSKSMKEYYYSGFDTFIYDNLFQFIKWGDEPYSIEELLGEE